MKIKESVMHLAHNGERACNRQVSTGIKRSIRNARRSLLPVSLCPT